MQTHKPAKLHAADYSVESLESRTLLSAVAQPQTLADLPAGAQQSISSSIGNDQSAYHATSGASGVTLANPGNGPFVQEAELSGDGSSIAIDGNTAAVGGAGANEDEGQAKVFTKSASGWPEVAFLNPPDGGAAEFGSSVAVSGNTIVVGAGGPNIYIFVEPTGGWTTMTQTAELTVPSMDGFPAVAISGNTVVASTGGAAYVWVEPSSGWANVSPTAELTASDGVTGDEFGGSISISGDTVVVGATDALSPGNGRAYVFTEPSSGWANMTQTAELTRTGGDDDFGGSVSVSGGTIAVGAPGAAYVYVEPASGWGNMTQTAELDDPDVGDGFGASVAISGDTLVVGATSENVGGSVDQGAAFAYTISGSSWANASPIAELTDANGAENESFGTVVSVSGGTIVVAAANSATALVFGSGGGQFDSKLAFAQQPTTSVVANAIITPPITVDVEDSSGAVVTADDSDVTIFIAGGPAGAGLGGTLTEQAVGGVATFSDLSLSTPGTYALIAYDGSLATAGSSTITVTAAGSGGGGGGGGTGGGSTDAQLAFAQQPTNALSDVDIAPPITVDVENSSGQIVTSDDSQVTLTIATGPTTAGSLSATAVNGVATFPGLYIGTPGAYTLLASDGTLSTATSNPFTISAASTLVPTLGRVSLPSAVVAGAKLTAKVPVVVANTGSSLKGNVTVDLYADTGTTLDGNQVLVSFLTKKVSLKAGKDQSFVFSVRSLPQSLPDGTYHLIEEVIDPSGATNIAATTQTVDVAAAFVQPAVSVAAVIPGSVAFGKSGSILITVTNDGNVTASGVDLALSPSADGATPLAGVILESVKSGGKITPGKSKTFKLHFKATSPLAAGSYYPYLSVSLGGVSTTAVGTNQFTVE